MKENVDVAVTFRSDGTQVEKNVKSIRQELREAQQEAVNLARQFGELSPEAINAAKRVAQLKDEFGDLKNRIDALDPDAKFRAFSQSLQGVAGGFAGLQGAIGLFGTESEELQKQLLKVQSALALSEGLNSVLAARDSFRTLGVVIKTNVLTALTSLRTAIASGLTTAFTTLRGAIIATGIGALAVGVGLLIANFETVKKVVLNLVPGLSKVGDVIGKIVQKVTDFVGITSEAERASERLSKSTKTRNEAIDRQIKLLQAQGGKEAEIAKLQKEKADNEIKNIDAQTKAGKISADERKKQLLDLQNEKAVIDAAEKKRLADIAKQDAEARKKEREAKRKEREQEIEEERQRRQAEIRKAAEDARALYEAGQKELRDANAKSAEENRLAQFTESQREIEELTTAYNEKLNKAKEFGINIQAVTDEYNRKVAEIQAKQDLKDVEAQIAKDAEAIAKVENDFANDYAIIEAQRQAILTLEDDAEGKRTKLLEENSKARKAIEGAEYEFKKKQIQETGQLLTNLGQIVGQQTAAGKALGIATALINTYQGATEALKEKSTLPQPFSTIARFAAAGAIIANGLRTVKQIASVKVPGGGGGGGAGSAGSSGFSGGVGGAGGASVPTQAPIAQSVQVQQTQTVGTTNVAIQDQTAVKAFVVERDITDSQDRISKIKAAATI